MRSLGFGLVLGLALPFAAACGASDTGTGDDTSPDAAVEPTTRGFQVVSPEITIPAGKEITYCYYFKTPNTEDMVIKKWVSKMSPGSHHMIMFTTQSEVKPAGTISDTECGVAGASPTNLPAWIFAAQTAEASLTLPTDDGNGKPLGQEIKAGSPAYIQMHYLNATDADIKVHVQINAEAYDVGAPYTATAPYITFNNQINIDKNLTKDPSIIDTETLTCATPPGTKFWLLSTHAHKQAVKTEIKNGMPASTEVAFTSTDWEHPGQKEIMTTPFYSFSGDKLTYSCSYANVGSNYDRIVKTGDSAQFDEMCMATGYYFPATKSRICFNNYLLP